MLFYRLYKVVLAAIVFASVLAPVDAADYQEGKDYQVVAGIPENPGAVVREFFSYNCPHCYHQDATFSETAKLLKDKVRFERTPVGVGRTEWVMSQKAYYVANKFNIVGQVHNEIFQRIHEQHKPFQRSQDLIDFFTAQGVAADELTKLVDSADIKLALANYDAQTQLAGIRGVPSLLVNGKYLLLNHSKDPQALANLIQFLAQQ
ncbi:thiol:disulfide interchange protein DsbA/DsbL [Shewanella avicenniae]|uniref:Thiol:disulfide interchange protein n=1 Tax=Shewanella avicenniae TaxID=2814294 RepID=A0ABX7QUH3_9GAMM|nr:thiol:disulfide interchange protein DsbA/DsbL [Shewanella avicenniae]QSX35094.1 thiol:disulfide interchange protein DsbA/DsbL [Shewanella avicenniae]